MVSEKNIYPTVDLLKFVFAICIVGIHTNILSVLPEKIAWNIAHLVFRLAVPYFFVASGYFLGRKLFLQKSKEKHVYKNIWLNYVKRLLPPLFLWGTIGLLFNIITLSFAGKNFPYIMLDTIRKALFYPLGAMWFVAACIVGAAVICYFMYANKLKVALLAAGGGYLFALMANTYYYLFEGTIIGKVISLYLLFFVSARNGLFVGFPFMLLGVCLAQPNIKQKISLSIVWVSTVAAAFTFFLEVQNLYGKTLVDDHSLFLSFLVLIPGLFYLSLQYDCKFQLPYLWLRRLSTGIFFTHAFFNNLFKIFHFTAPLQFVVVLLCAISVTILITKSDCQFLKQFI